MFSGCWISKVMEKDARVKKTAAPSVEQINAEYVTQVRIH